MNDGTSLESVRQIRQSVFLIFETNSLLLQYGETGDINYIEIDDIHGKIQLVESFFDVIYAKICILELTSGLNLSFFCSSNLPLWLEDKCLFDGAVFTPLIWLHQRLHFLWTNISFGRFYCSHEFSTVIKMTYFYCWIFFVIFYSTWSFLW